MPKLGSHTSEVVVSSEQIKQLAERHKLNVPDFPTFEASIRSDFEVFQRDRTAISANHQHDEIDRLYKTANRGKVVPVITALRNLSQESIASLSERGDRIGLALPNPAQLAEAHEPLPLCQIIARLCRIGGKWNTKEDTSDNTPRRWVTELHAPEKKRNFAKRAAEKAFIINLQLTWLKTTGQMPAVTANHEVPGPFVRFVKDCLSLAGVEYVDVVETLNSITHDRKYLLKTELDRMWITP